MKPINPALKAALAQGRTLGDYAVLQALAVNAKPMTRQDLEQVTGMLENAVRLTTDRLIRLDLIQRDKTPQKGGGTKNAAKYTLR